MSPREIGCRTVGCGLGMLLVLSFFGMMMNVANTSLRDAVKKRAAMDARRDLPLLHQGITRFASARRGTLPSLETPGSLKAALYPAYVTDEETFRNQRDRKAYQTNPSLAGKTLAEAKRLLPKESAALLYEASPNALGLRRVLLLDGTIREVYASDWEAFRKAAKLDRAR